MGRVQVFGAHLLKQKLDKVLDKIAIKYTTKIEPIEKNSLLWLQTTSELTEDLDRTYNKLISLILLTDKLESSLSQKDEYVDITF